MPGPVVTVLILVMLSALSALFVGADTWPDVGLSLIASLVTFVAGFCRGWWVNNHRWETQAHQLARILEADGVPVSIVAPDPPGGHHHPFERLL